MICRDLHCVFDGDDQLLKEIAGDVNTGGATSITTYTYGPSNLRTMQTLKSIGGTTDTQQYDWDLQGRLAQVTAAHAGTTTSTTAYTYPSNGDRIGQVLTIGTNSTTSTYLIDNNNFTGYSQTLEERIGNPDPELTINRTYLWGLDLAGQYDFQDGNLVPLKDGHGSTRMILYLPGDVNADGIVDIQDFSTVANHWQQTTPLGVGFGDVNGDHIVNISDTSVVANNWQNSHGWLISQLFAYSAYGESILATNLANGNNARTPYLFSGEFTDSNLGLQYNRARFYSPSTGTWMSLDPFFGNNNDPGSLHKYLYTDANPVNRRDPSGQMGIIEFAANMSLEAGIRASIYAPRLAPAVFLVARVSGALLLASLVQLEFERRGVLPRTGYTEQLVDYSATALFGSLTLGEMLIALQAAKPVPRDARDRAVDGRRATAVKDFSRPVARNPVINVRKDAEVKQWLMRPGVRDIRVNQWQVDETGVYRGTNLPDVQYTENGIRTYIECDQDIISALQHRQRILANDPNGVVYNWILGPKGVWYVLP